MICPNCGAAYSETEIQCPYCKSENKVAAERRQLLKLKKIEEDAAEIRKLPKKIVSKSTKILLVSGCCLAVGIVIVMLSTYGYSKASSSRAYQILQNNLDQLEAYYKEQSYLEIYDYMDEHNLYGNSYEKYREISTAYYYHSKMGEVEEERNQGKDIRKEDTILSSIQWGLDYGADALSICQKGIEDNGILGNEDSLMVLYEEIAAKLEGEYKLTRDEIGRLSLEESAHKEYLENLAREVNKRLE